MTINQVEIYLEKSKDLAYQYILAKKELTMKQIFYDITSDITEGIWQSNQICTETPFLYKYLRKNLSDVEIFL